MPSMGIPEITIILFLLLLFGIVVGGVFLLVRALGGSALTRRVEALESEVRALRAEVSALSGAGPSGPTGRENGAQG
jgi:hypothetical protein